MSQRSISKLCHSDRSIAIGFISRDAEWRACPELAEGNLLLFAAYGTQGIGHHGAA